MKIVKNNLHPVMMRFLLSDDYDNPDGISATGLAEATKIILLKERHKDEIVTDVRMGWRSRLGSAIHKFLESLGDEEEVTEERLYMYVGDTLVSGKFDLLEPVGDEWQIHDYKTTQPYSFEKEKQKVLHEMGDVAYLEKWQKQLSVYKLLLEVSKGLKIMDTAIVHCLCTNYDVRYSKREYYPKHEIFSVRVPLISESDTMLELRRKIAEIEDCRALPDGQLPDCTEKDTWEGNRCVFKQRGGGRWQVPWCPVYKWCNQRSDAKDPVKSGIEVVEV